ncbi:hypothetical protein EXM22_09820 [Oceanispirochaeta crateris]|uniref:Hydroxyacid dehydrogenase n=1 Tax=Oceanispirochaeta crateris TaxID=2518645 RepID=A0A5C1QM31_9SPIO|nr:NAD(P)-dependent oxidoreductase [Oceanispirochaeta crateris]QEN08269.1 hypothetical protein EXM22_09820 [Oceanispirochaeta crateris]
MYTIVLTHNLPLDRFSDLLSNMNVIFPETPLSKFSDDEIKEHVKDADVLITIADFECPASLIELAPNLKAIGNLGSGFNNIDVKTATEKGILVLNTPVSVMESTAEMTIALMMSICRSTVLYDRELRKDLVCKPSLLLERDMVLSGRTLGIIGFGRIGKSVAQKAVGLGMNVVYNDLYQATKEDEERLNARFMSAEDVIKEADVLTLHMPYFPEYHHYMNKERLGMMKNTSYLINASRGPIVEEKALIQALKAKSIRGAALDVHEFEPNISKEIAELPNIVITPHCCTNIADVRLDMLGELLNGMSLILKGEQASNVVNREALNK